MLANRHQSLVLLKKLNVSPGKYHTETCRSWRHMYWSTYGTQEIKKKKIEGTGKKFIHMEEHISIHTCKTNQKIRTLKSLLPQHLLVTVTQELTSKKSGYLMSSQSFTGYAKILDIAAATSSVALQSKRTLYRNYWSIFLEHGMLSFHYQHWHTDNFQDPSSVVACYISTLINMLYYFW